MDPHDTNGPASVPPDRPIEAAIASSQNASAQAAYAEWASRLPHADRNTSRAVPVQANREKGSRNLSRVPALTDFEPEELIDADNLIRLLGLMPYSIGKPYEMEDIARHCHRYNVSLEITEDTAEELEAELALVDCMVSMDLTLKYGGGVYERLDIHRTIAKQYGFDEQFVLATSIISAGRAIEVDHVWLRHVLKRSGLTSWKGWPDDEPAATQNQKPPTARTSVGIDGQSPVVDGTRHWRRDDPMLRQMRKRVQHEPSILKDVLPMVNGLAKKDPERFLQLLIEQQINASNGDAASLRDGDIVSKHRENEPAKNTDNASQAAKAPSDVDQAKIPHTPAWHLKQGHEFRRGGWKNANYHRIMIDDPDSDDEGLDPWGDPIEEEQKDVNDGDKDHADSDDDVDSDENSESDDEPDAGQEVDDGGVLQEQKDLVVEAGDPEAEEHQGNNATEEHDDIEMEGAVDKAGTGGDPARPGTQAQALIATAATTTATNTASGNGPTLKPSGVVQTFRCDSCHKHTDHIAKARHHSWRCGKNSFSELTEQEVKDDLAYRAQMREIHKKGMEKKAEILAKMQIDSLNEERKNKGNDAGPEHDDTEMKGVHDEPVPSDNATLPSTQPQGQVPADTDQVLSDADKQGLPAGHALISAVVIHDAPASSDPPAAAEPVGEDTVLAVLPNGEAVLRHLGIWPSIEPYTNIYTAASLARHLLSEDTVLTHSERAEAEKTLSTAIRKSRDQTLNAQWGPGFAKEFVTQCSVAKKHGYDLQWAWAAAASINDVDVPPQIFNAICVANNIPDLGVKWAQGKLERNLW